MSRTLVLSPESEISIEMDPGSHSAFMGSRMSLEAAGLVPEDIKWPVGSDWSIWEEGPFRCALLRFSFNSRMKQSVWDTQDSWRLCMIIRNKPSDHQKQSIIAEKARELAHAAWRLSPAGEQQRERWRAARKDKGYCEFMEKVLPPKKTRAKREAVRRVAA
jgi:hypothetical protein